MKIAISFILLIFFFNCSQGEISDKTVTNKKITIRSNGKATTRYILNKQNQVIQSQCTNEYGNTVTRFYRYNPDNELASVLRTGTSYPGTQTFNLNKTTSRDGSGRIVQQMKSYTTSRGTFEQLVVDYFYDEKGVLVGMSQTDPNGNIQTKGSE